MKHILLLFFSTTIFFVSGHMAAHAADTENCPARIYIPVAEDPTASPSALFGFTIEASTPRNFTGDVVFYTSNGWYQVSVPHVAMMYVVRHSVAQNGTLWPEPGASSGVSFVQFPQALTILDAWIIRGTADSAQWVGKGIVECRPTGSIGDAHYQDPKKYRWHLPANELAAFLPTKQALAIVPPLLAKQIAALEPTNCDTPFISAATTKATDPWVPGGIPHGTAAITTVEIAINPDGKLIQAKIYESSNNPTLDHAALRAALDSKYSPATLYCRKTSGIYLFKAIFYNP